MKSTSAAILKLHCVSCTESVIKMAAMCTQDQPLSDNSAVDKTFTQQSTSLFATLQQTAQAEGGQRNGFFDRQEMVNARLQHCSYSRAPLVKRKLK